MQILEGKKYYDFRTFSDLREMLVTSTELYGELDAFVFRDTPSSEVKRRSYKEFLTDVKSLTTVFDSRAYRGKTIAVIGDNSYAWCVAYMAVVCGVGVVMPLDKLLPPEEVTELLTRGKADIVVYDPPFHETMLAYSQELDRDMDFICMNDFLFKKEPGEFPENFYLMKDFLADGLKLVESGQEVFSDLPIDPEAIMALLFTSGTTAASKAVMLSHKNISSDIMALAGVVYLEPGTKLLSVLPLHHTFENTCGLLTALYYGLAIHESDGLRYIQKNMKEYAIDMIIAVPLLFESFYTKILQTVKKQGKEKKLRTGIKLSNFLRKFGIDKRRKLFAEILDSFGGSFSKGICGAAPINPEIISFFDSIGVRILQGYGLTETSPVVAGCNDRVFVPGTVGHPLTGVELAIDNEKDGEEGEILVRGDIVMLGYFEDEEATAELIDEDGWFRTGDIGVIHPRNKTLTITGRQKSMVVLKNGKKVFPEEIEFLLGQYDIVKESLVWGEIEEDGDVDVWVRIVLNPDALKAEGGDPDDEEGTGRKISELLKEVNKKMPSFKSIKHFIFGHDDMEKTTTKKIKRNIELKNLKDMLSKGSMKVKEISGRNIDDIKKNLEGKNKDSGE